MQFKHVLCDSFQSHIPSAPKYPHPLLKIIIFEKLQKKKKKKNRSESLQNEEKIKQNRFILITSPL